MLEGDVCQFPSQPRTQLDQDESDDGEDIWIEESDSRIANNQEQYTILSSQYFPHLTG